ncbi:GM18916 [Drosophila sechellia]|uniref:GM18916 n=1 Tax=Drosophila sechellia TaxID=7238 RepID=B4I9P6_DROSE|nr:GM18916 [Drosophila sechellia]
MEVQQQLQLQQQLSEASGGGAASAGAGGAASPANSQQSQQQQHSTAISTMSPMQLAAATGGVGGDWTQGRTVQLMQPSTSFLYPQMIVSGNLLHPGGLGQQPIQVITAGKPFQGNGPQMLTTTTQNAKQMIGGQAGFAGGNYATCIPTNHNQSPQTVLFSPMNVISPQQQQNLLQSMAAAAQQQQLTQQQQQFNQQQQQQLTQQQQQLTAALAKVGVDAQGKLAQKVVQKGPPLLTPTTNPILAMTSMMNATVGHLSTAPPVTVSVTSTAVTSSPGQLVLLSTASSGGGGSIPATPTKETPSKGPTATLVPIGSPKTPVSAKDTCTTPKSSTPATVSASVEASSSTSEALSNGDASDRSSTPSKGATTPTSKQSNAVQPPSSTTPSSVSGKEEPKLATSGSLTSATSTSTTTTITNGIGVARTTASTTAVSTASTTTTSSGTFTTSCTSTTTTTTSGISNGSKDLPKAMIKPNVLTHVIDGFIIQEANEPFPVTRQRYADKDVSDEPPKKKATMQEDIKLSGIASAPGSDMVACEQCGKMEHKAKLKRKRYCSPGCSRQAKNGIGGVGSGETNGLGTGGIVGVDAMALVDRLDEAMAEEKMQTEATPKLSESFPILGASTEVPPMSLPVQAAISASSPLAMPLGSPLSVALPTLAPLSVVTSGATPKSSEVNGTDRPPISSWSVDDVSNFIRELPGCQDYVDDFIQQEIDGQALLLLKEKHLVNAMGMKLGPALKIVAKVESIKEVPPPGEAKDPGAQ